MDGVFTATDWDQFCHPATEFILSEVEGLCLCLPSLQIAVHLLNGPDNRSPKVTNGAVIVNHKRG